MEMERAERLAELYGLLFALLGTPDYSPAEADLLVRAIVAELDSED